MSNCKVPSSYTSKLFKELQKLDLKLYKSGIEIVKALRDTALSFSTSPDFTIDLLGYNDSISILAGDLNRAWKSATNSDQDLTDEIIDALKAPKYTPAEKYSTDHGIDENVLILDEAIKSAKYDLMLLNLFGSDIKVDKLRLIMFSLNLPKLTIVNTDSKRLVTKVNDLNLNIIDYLETLYQKVKSYIEVLNGKSDIFPETLYTDNKKNFGWDNVIYVMLNIISKLLNDGTFITKFGKGRDIEYRLNGDDSEDYRLYDAVNAFINLFYFDTIIEKEFNKFIRIDKSTSDVITTKIDDLGIEHTLYRYQLLVGNLNATKTWGNESPDAIKETSQFGNLLIGIIPLYNYNIDSGVANKTKQTPLTKDFMGCFTLLKNATLLLTDIKFSRFYNLINSIPNSSAEIMVDILNELFNNGENSKILLKALTNSRNRFFLSASHINLLYSVYKTVFSEDDSSWRSIEYEYLKLNGFRSGYNLVDSIYELIKSSSAINYLLTLYDFNSGKLVTDIKDKYNLGLLLYDFVKGIRDRNNSGKEVDYSNYFSKYKVFGGDINYDELRDAFSSKEFTIRIGNNDYNIKRDNTNKYLLSTSDDSIIKNIDNFIKGNDILISKADIREKLLNRVNLSPKELQFLDLLLFIDDMLGTNFSRSLLELNEFALALLGNEEFDTDIFKSAIKILIANITYLHMKSIKINGNRKYSDSDLIRYMDDTSERLVALSTNYNDAKYYYYNSILYGRQFKCISETERWVINLSTIRALLSGDTNKSTIKNLEGKNIPNYTPTFLCAELHSQLSKSKSKPTNATSSLLFAKNPKALCSISINTDVRTLDGITKLIKNLSETELLVDSIIHKFLLPLENSNKHIYIQSSTQSDKTRIVSHEIDLLGVMFNDNNLEFKDAIKDPKLMQLIFISKLKESVGGMYKKSLYNVLLDYHELYPDTVDIPINNGSNWDLVISLINNILKSTSEKQLMRDVNDYNKNHEQLLTFKLDLHYRIAKNGLAFNELLYHFSEELYSDDKRLISRINKEKLNFIRDLLDKFFAVKVTDLIEKIFKTLGLSINDWTRLVGEDRYLVLVDLKGNKIIYEDIDPKVEFKLNPILESYFYILTLIANNLRYGTTGSEINHPVKSFKSINLSKILSLRLNISKFDKIKDLPISTFFDLAQVIKSAKESLKNTLSTIYDEYIYSLENQAQLAQFKRNVIYSASLTKISPSLDGIPDTMKVACIRDITSKVFGFDGTSEDGLEVHNGSALLSPLWSILENKSLGPNECGIVKKPIQHSLDDRFGTATLFKYATFAMTNLWMRLSVGNLLQGSMNGIDMQKLFKKMHNQRWNGNIDLINGFEIGDSHKIYFSLDILELKTYPENRLFYKNKNEYREIVDFGRENGVYYTDEVQVDLSGTHINNLTIRVYHYFTDIGEHIPSERLLDGLHTIDSLYELHTALGGIWSMSLKDDLLQYSEASNNCVVNFINYVISLDKETGEYIQPLKYMLIAEVINNTAVKNGAGNINESEKYFNDEELYTMYIDTDTYGKLQDTDHDSDNSEMTEPSLVISSLDVRGYIHDSINDIYEELAITALNASSVELDAVKLFINSEFYDKSPLYDMVFRTIESNIKSGKNEAGLGLEIVNIIKLQFNLHSNHEDDKLKMPFSDNNIYSLIFSTMVAIINKKSIKRKYPGLGMPLVPSYGFTMVYDIPGESCPYLFEDILKEASLNPEIINDSRLKDITDQNTYNKTLVLLFLDSKLKLVESYTNMDSFIPTDNIIINHFGTTSRITIDDPITYYSLKDPVKLALYLYKDINIITEGDTIILGNNLMRINGNTLTVIQSDANLYKVAGIILQGKLINIIDESNLPISIQTSDVFTNNNGIISVNPVYYTKDITRSRNLAPSKITFKYKVDGLEKIGNIFDLDLAKDLILGIYKIQTSGLSNEDKKLKISKLKRQIRLQDAYVNLDKGIAVINGKEVQIYDLNVEPAECIASNIYLSIFGILDGESMIDVLHRQTDITTKLELIESTNYDLKFARGNKRDTYITFRPIARNTDDFNSYLKEWSSINKVAYKRKEGVNYSKDTPLIVNRVYVTDSDNIRLFEVGREIVADGVTFDLILDKFVKDGKPVKNLKDYILDKDKNGNQRVLLYIEFISRREVTETINGEIVTYTLYNINKDNIAKCIDHIEYTEALRAYKNESGDIEYYSLENKFALDLNKFISKLLADVYNSDSYDGVIVNNKLNRKSAELISKLLRSKSNSGKYFCDYIEYDKPLQEFLIGVKSLLDTKLLSKDEFISIKLRKLYNEYALKLNHIKLVSFLKSRYFTVSRIPAQTHQSFMLMKNIGFTGESTGQIYVPTWLTWLLGSDYRLYAQVK